jgi:uncharacterized protein YkwD
MGRLRDWIKKLLGGNTPPPQPPTPPPANIEEIKQRLLTLHNQLRANKGLPALTRVSELDRAAQLHNDYMARIDFLTHNEPRRDIGDRVKEQGYDWHMVGENIAWNQQTVEDVMASWMNSTGHRANMLSANFKDVGFGVTHDGSEWWWTADFGSR